MLKCVNNPKAFLCWKNLSCIWSPAYEKVLEMDSIGLCGKNTPTTQNTLATAWEI